MKMSEMIKETIGKHKAKIELFQWAIIASVASLVYSEFVKNIHQKEVPIRAIHVPALRNVRELLDENGNLSYNLSNYLIDHIVEDELFKKYKDLPELELFKEENIEVLKTIFDLYVLPNIRRRIPETIDKKFGLSNPEQQLIREDYTIDLFNREDLNLDQLKYIEHQTILQLFITLPSLQKKQEFPENNSKIYMMDNEILTVNHENAICPIHFDKAIIDTPIIMDLLSMVTNTKIIETDRMVQGEINKERHWLYEITSNPFNRVFVTSFLDEQPKSE